MILRTRTLVLVAGLVVTLAGSAFAKKGTSTHVVAGTITSIDANQVVISEKVKNKEQAMTFKVDPSTQETGTLKDGVPVTVQYRTDNNQNIATAIRERAATPAAAPKAAKKSKS